MDSFHELGLVSLHLHGLKLLGSYCSPIGGSIRIAAHPELGKILLLRHEIQHVEAWAPLYHESLIHLASSFVPQIRKVLILGGGSLYAAQEALKYTSAKEVTLVEHDKYVVRAVTEHYPHARKALADPRLKILYQDALSFLQNTPLQFDLIANDAIDLFNCGPHPLMRYEILTRRLSSRGVCCDLVYRHIFERKTTQQTIRLLSKEYHSAFSLIAVPEYPGVLHVLTIWGNSGLIKQASPNVVNSTQKQWLQNGTTPCEFYNPRCRGFYLYLPPYIRRMFWSGKTMS